MWSRRRAAKRALRIEWRNFPILGDESQNAARAAWTAGRQGRFWAYHDALYGHAPAKKNTGAFTADELVAPA
ncbi:DsbA family protein [Streptomyces sp. 8L]|uniref:DsbA family protein n=1 Tax=Streptomyces sp. 8L TaxID=2877242 RepID=UPI0035A98E62